ncbi:IclR family transcriptional regulator [Arthrobacter sp. MYb213]|uniref:IclR family transcriptional regulator n=1 Tax=Arthrobacter sp. MYb213 TaxID=1848595 RepID=UPI00256FFD34|nr:IclR family transcriptional regulator [Arthrobacter sp. MYb213]
MSSTSASSRDNRTAVDKAMALLRAFGEEATTGVGVSELARRAELSKSTAFRLLASLQSNDAVERAGNAYRLGKMIQNLGTTQESDLHARLRDALTPFMVNLYETTRQTVHLAILQGTDVVYLNKLYGQLAVRSPSRIGGRLPSYCTAVGKVLLAYNPDAAQTVLSKEMYAWTENTITDADRLSHELTNIRRDHVGYDRDEVLLGLNCVAAPVFNGTGQAVAALSISGPTGRFNPESQTSVLRRVTYEASRAAAAVSAAVQRT